MAAFSWRQLAAAWVVVLVLGLLAAGVFAVVPRHAAQANPALHNAVIPQYNPLRLNERPSFEEGDGY
jgi:hypothetical protein